jgi:hypothetical protein
VLNLAVVLIKLQQGNLAMTETLDFETRDRIIFGKAVDWENRRYPPGVCERFEQLDVAGIDHLIQLGFMELQQTMNSTPTVEAFLDFARSAQAQGHSFHFEGFAFDPRSPHAKEVSLEGIYYQGNYPAEIGLSFAKFVIPYRPDEIALEDDLLRAWWD